MNLIADSMDDYIAVLDQDGRKVYGSRAYDRLFGKGWSDGGGDCFERLHPDDREQVRAVLQATVETGCPGQTECRFVLPDGSVRGMESRVALMRGEGGQASQVVVISRDITARKQAEEVIRSLAFYDALTQLPNRRLLEDRLVQAMAACRRSGSFGVIVFLDLNNFKPLNDQYGHDLGDALLVEAARRMSYCVRQLDTVARFGGDEFVVVLSELDCCKQLAAAEALAVVEKIQAALTGVYLLEYVNEDGERVPVSHCCSASFGVTLFSGHESGHEVLLKWADTAMYQAKKNGGEFVCFPENAEDVTQSGTLYSKFCYARVCGCAARREKSGWHEKC